MPAKKTRTVKTSAPATSAPATSAPATAPVTIFDGHNDTLLRLAFPTRKGENTNFFERGTTGHIDYPRAVEGGLGGGFFAVYAPAKSGRGIRKPPKFEALMTADGYAVPLPDPLKPDYALAVTMTMSALLFRLERESGGRLRVVRTAGALADCLHKGVMAAIYHIEGADMIDPQLDTLEVLYQAGLRSVGIVWSRPNAFGHGVPFAFPQSPDTGPGLTDAGKALVKACNQLGIMLDLSHLNEAGFWDVARMTDAPLVATHSNAHALCPSSRNLTDKQLDAIKESDGIVGLNFATPFLRDDGSNKRDTPLAVMVRHIDYLVERLGIDRVGLGSDFDGAPIPDAIRDVAGLPRLIDALRQAGYDDAALRKIGHENWLRVLRRTWQA